METTKASRKQVDCNPDKPEAAPAPPPYSAMDDNLLLEMQAFTQDNRDAEVGLLAAGQDNPAPAVEPGTASLLCSSIVAIVDKTLGFLKFVIGCHPMPCSLLVLVVAILGLAVVLLAAGTAAFGPEFLLQVLRALRGSRPA